MDVASAGEVKIGAKEAILVIGKRPISVVLLLLSSYGVAQAATASGDPPKLIPTPREYAPREPLSLARGVSVLTDSDPEDLFAAHDLSAFFERLGHPLVRVSKSSGY
jgi:hypothetical protein